MSHDFVRATPPRHLPGTVHGSIVDDDDLDTIDPRNVPRNVSEHLGKVVRLVVTGDLNDELQCSMPLPLAEAPPLLESILARQALCKRSHSSAQFFWVVQEAFNKRPPCLLPLGRDHHHARIEVLLDHLLSLKLSK